MLCVDKYGHEFSSSAQSLYNLLQDNCLRLVKAAICHDHGTKNIRAAENTFLKLVQEAIREDEGNEDTIQEEEKADEEEDDCEERDDTDTDEEEHDNDAVNEDDGDEGENDDNDAVSENESDEGEDYFYKYSS